MKNPSLLPTRLLACITLSLGALVGAQAAPTLVNGGFESGLAGWTRFDQPGSDGGFGLQTGTDSPVNAFVVPAPPGGANAAMTDSGAGGSHVMYQDFLVPAAPGAVTLSFDLYLNNQAGVYATPANLDWATIAQNQQARVDIITTSADLFSLLAGDVLFTVFNTQVGDPSTLGYTTVSKDISAVLAAHAGETLRLRFAEVDNILVFNMGVDNVTLADNNSVPEPSSALLVALALGATGLASRRRKSSVGAARAVVARAGAVLSAAALGCVLTAPARADTIPAALLDPTLQVSTVLNAGLSQPIGIVFINGIHDYFVLEKASGQVKRVIGGVLQAQPVLDLQVNANSERGLLSMVLHPNFPATPHVYVRWTESSTGTDSTVVSEVPLLGNRVDRFLWRNDQLVQDINIVRLRARQTDNVSVSGQDPSFANPGENGNHNGGVMRFGPDGKLYIFMGDQGRRGWLQNLANGPFLKAPQVDDTFGGPAPDDAHLTGVVLRLNEDGTTPADNPFFGAGVALGGVVGANIQKIYSYGHRNGFGMAFDPVAGWLWLTENADDAYSEINRVVPGMNGGWIQFAGPASRVPDWKLIETTQFGLALQQRRYPPTRAAYTRNAALARLVMLPGAVYKDPELSWRYETGPSGTAFVQGDALGAAYNGTLWVGSARGFSQVGANGGALYRIKLNADRLSVDTSADPRLADKVADNLFRAQKFEGTESETLKVGQGFGTVGAIEQGPDGNLYVVSLTDNTIYKISKAP